MIQMRLLNIIVDETLGPEIAKVYRWLYDVPAKKGTVYTTLGVMFDRGWIRKERDSYNRSCKAILGNRTREKSS